MKRKPRNRQEKRAEAKSNMVMVRTIIKVKGTNDLRGDLRTWKEEKLQWACTQRDPMRKRSENRRRNKVARAARKRNRQRSSVG